MSRKTFDGVDDAGGAEGAWPATSLLRPGGFSLPIAPGTEESAARGPTLAASACANDKEPIRHSTDMIPAWFFIYRGPFPYESPYKSNFRISRSAAPALLCLIN